ncbi:MAG: large repetitive protein, partial [Solirubrobacterales bacterium]|nr:large repetitive protein [Solirubrobacterales bacterium]
MQQRSLKGRRSRIAIVIAVSAIAVMVLAAIALADNVVNNVTAGGNDTFTAGGSTTVNYQIHATGSTCDAADGSSATLTFHAPAGVTATPTSRTYTTCGTDQSVVFSSNTPGNYSITVTIADTAGSYNDQADFTLHVLNRAPTCANDSASTNEDTPLTRSVASDCSDADGNPLTYAVTQNPAHGSLTSFNTSTGAFTYAPAANYNGPDSFKFKANDGTADSAAATFSLTVNPVNDPPVCAAGSNSTNEDTPLTDSVAPSCSDVDGNTLTYSVTQNPSHGTLTSFNTSTGAFTYSPASNYNGPDSFKFKANDGTVNSAEATFSLTVNPVNDAPTCSAGSKSTNEDTALTDAVSCSDVDGNPLTYSVTQAPAHGSFNGTFNSSTGGFTYTPDPNYNGPDSFKFQANDGTANSNVATFSLTVNAVNDPPVAVNDPSYSVNEDTTLNQASPGGVLANDTDTEGDPLTASLV